MKNLKNLKNMKNIKNIKNVKNVNMNVLFKVIGEGGLKQPKV